MKHLLTYNIFESSLSGINSYEELLSLLKKYNIPLEKWGTGVYKTPKHLWKELQEKECVLSERDGKLYRDVDFVGARILYKKDGVNYRLWEDRAKVKDGRIRIRPIEHSMAEKFKSGENPINSLIRGMEEELGIKLKDNQFTYYNKDRFENNGDYPGIHSFHNGYFYLITLTDSQFNPEGYVEKQSDKTIYFVWRKVEPKIAGYYPLPLGSDKVVFEKMKFWDKKKKRYGRIRKRI
jgi:hypothetical protein